MISFNSEMLIQFVSEFFWPLVRVLALFSTAPLFSEKQAPKKVKIGLAVMVTLLLMPNLQPAQVPIFSVAAFWVMLQQILIGASLGLTMQIAFAAVRHAGEVIGLQMGLSFATFFDPSGGPNMPILARIFNLLTLLLFLAFDGHLWLLSVLADTFQILPVQPLQLSAQGFLLLAQSASMIFINGMMLALPLITLLLTLNLSLGILNRMTPQLSIFVVGFPLTLTTGILVLTLLIPMLAPFTERMFSELFNRLAVIISGMVI
ncbi:MULTISPECIES: flagellar biosynthetic protein FliR [Photorhabdus]|uniref:Flagellar biosynthetic protein FliR n=2 Tax=Photorhabdus TaxID=29487 RepID=A0ABX0B7W0_9GAMM|nr:MULTISPECIES: flagellar biosynthetic protein FliR [Photorhabdus]MCC8374158.1 flagellar type III secretion system protein FliR [Photorhabdus bodei]MCT8352103.1 flagellar type III secretion system protein FliR [Photorhabdus kayaii]MDB6370026.1 flagellar biosynthetic protein FliR [Photorhabdus bodei]MDB6374193.1 flagellar biosynthetic protein FliR [Photorhabdus bodei]NDL13996.1 flagellar type III secretion system protein FliR [Photorhabdus kayaii]